MYVQLAFALDRVKALAGQHPEWKRKQPFRAVLDNDIAALAKAGEKGLVELVMATHAGMTTAEFAQIAGDWIKSARHPKFNRPYTDLVYQPMLELLACLRANGFKTFIVSGGGIEFMRPWSERVYGIPAGAGRRIEHQDEVRDRQGEADTDPAAGDRSRRRRTRQAGRHQLAYRPPADRGLRQFGRRLPDAAMGDAIIGETLRPDRASHRCRTRICIRSEVLIRQTRQGARRGELQWLDRCQHEGRLETHVPL
ncbi:haloacid dehalogenase-like hydrolase [Bradyrhizobium sp. USDA 4523]